VREALTSFDASGDELTSATTTPATAAGVPSAARASVTVTVLPAAVTDGNGSLPATCRTVIPLPATPGTTASYVMSSLGSTAAPAAWTVAAFGATKPVYLKVNFSSLSTFGISIAGSSNSQLSPEVCRPP
jgi:hypothetical protein